MNADPTLKVLYLLAVLQTGAYLTWHVTRRGYIFSPFTLVVLIYAFTLLVVGPLQYNPAAWAVLLKGYSSGLSNFLTENLKINMVGYLIMLGVMWATELSRKRGGVRPPLFRKTPRVSFSTMKAVTFLGIVLFIGCIAAEGGVIPLLGARTVFDQHTSLRPIYNFANLVILFGTSSLIVFKFVSNEYRGARTLIFVGMLCMLLTGGRTSVLSALELIIVLSIYRRRKTIRRRNIGRTVIASVGFVLIAYVGLYLASLRVNGPFSPAGVVNSIVDGNTFSDIRDGAFVMWGWIGNTHGEMLHGKTFLAGLLSFLPSSGSSFRLQYSWGYYTTSTLFGYSGHLGFRGGWSLESYLNFGWGGVALLAAANGWLLGSLERCFYIGFVRDRRVDYAQVYAFGWLAYILHTILIASSATYDVYSLLITFAGIWLVENVYSTHRGRTLRGLSPPGRRSPQAPGVSNVP